MNWSKEIEALRTLLEIIWQKTPGMSLAERAADEAEIFLSQLKADFHKGIDQEVEKTGNLYETVKRREMMKIKNKFVSTEFRGIFSHVINDPSQIEKYIKANFLIPSYKTIKRDYQRRSQVSITENYNILKKLDFYSLAAQFEGWLEAKRLKYEVDPKKESERVTSASASNYPIGSDKLLPRVLHGEFVSCGHDEFSTESEHRLFISYFRFQFQLSQLYFKWIGEDTIDEIPILCDLINKEQSVRFTINSSAPYFYLSTTFNVGHETLNEVAIKFRSNTETHPEREEFMFLSQAILKRIRPEGTFRKLDLVGRNLTPHECIKRLTTIGRITDAERVVMDARQMSLLEKLHK